MPIVNEYPSNELWKRDLIDMILILYMLLYQYLLTVKFSRQVLSLCV